MPNWCMNEMTISHNDPAMIKRAAEAWNAGEFLSVMIPEPDYKTTPVAKTFPSLAAEFAKSPEDRQAAIDNLPTIREDSWWDWRVQNWGTKWDIGLSTELDNQAEVQDNSFSVWFDSAWSPPTSAYDKLCEMGFFITASYYEPGCAFVGSYSNGVDDCYEIVDEEQAQAEIPNALLDRWDVIETLQNYNE